VATRSLNKVLLIGNLTRDPELRYTPQGTAVCTFGLATNRTWLTEGGEKREETEFHRIVAWNKLAELCAQLLFKGRRVYIEGRLQTRTWATQDGGQKQATEIVAEDMIILDSRRATEEEGAIPEVKSEESQKGGEEVVADLETNQATGNVEETQEGGESLGSEEESAGEIPSPSSNTPQSPSDEEGGGEDDIPF